MSKKTQPFGRCAFCNGFGLTKEHIWADWLTKRKAVPSQQTHQQTRINVDCDAEAKATIISPILSPPKQGPLVQKKVRRVCKFCNSGWMKKIVDDAIPYAEPLIASHSFVLGTEAQKKVASWIALSCIMAEFTDEKTMGIPQFDRDFIRQHGEPPCDWHIFLGRYEGRAWAPTSYRHHGVKIGLPGAVPTNSHASVQTYQISTYVLDVLVIQAASSTYPPVIEYFAENFAPTGMKKIWPESPPLNWPLDVALGDQDIDRIADAFSLRMLAEHGVGRD